MDGETKEILIHARDAMVFTVQHDSAVLEMANFPFFFVYFELCTIYRAKNTKFCRTLCTNLGRVTSDIKKGSQSLSLLQAQKLLLGSL